MSPPKDETQVNREIQTGSNALIGGRSAITWAGTSLFLAAAVAFMGIITAEVVYPGYSTRKDISDLGSTLPPDPIIHEPSATIFNTTMLASGALVLVGTYFVHRGLHRRILTISLAVFGVGIFGVGVFPGNIVPWHGLFAMTTFISGGITVLLSGSVTSRPFSYLCRFLGAISLLFLASAIGFGLTGVANPLQFLGSGGIERWVVYPLLIWLLAFGGYLLGTETESHTFN